MTNLIFDKGLRYIPVPPMSKAPVAKGWNLRENAISQESEAWRLDGKNVALALAYCDPPVEHLDCDDYPLARQELAKHNIDLKKVLTESSCVFHSGRKNSISALYRLPKDAPIPETKVLRVNDKVALEFRCGTKEEKTCASVIPDSTHPSGSKYQFLAGHSLNTIETIPLKLLSFALSLTNTRTPKKQATESAPKSFDQSETPRRRAVLIDLLRYIPADCDYVTWRDVVWGVLSTGWPSAYDLARNWSESGDWNPEQFHDLVTKFDPSMCGIDGPVSKGTVYYHARLRGYRG